MLKRKEISMTQVTIAGRGHLSLLRTTGPSRPELRAGLRQSVPRGLGVSLPGALAITKLCKSAGSELCTRDGIRAKLGFSNVAEGRAAEGAREGNRSTLSQLLGPVEAVGP